MTTLKPIFNEGRGDNPKITIKMATQHVGLKVLHAEDLLSGNKEVAIKHGTEIYRLRLTRQNRLLLTK